ncbi:MULTISPECIES: hypothetical protein [unclassified Oceanobacillus]|uniref:hypothetical protein n=1 Tax=unclassified Oceanobacillus TaxID=2630292 RepID=UPI0012EC1327|nr:hypothetical protein [Oceanobacillus sp. AG]
MFNNEEIENVINNFEFKIKKALRNTTYQEREDLEQEIKTKITEKLKTIEFEEPPNFWCLIKQVKNKT